MRSHHLVQFDAVRHFVAQRWIPEKKAVLNLENVLFLLYILRQSLPLELIIRTYKSGILLDGIFFKKRFKG